MAATPETKKKIKISDTFVLKNSLTLKEHYKCSKSEDT